MRIAPSKSLPVDVFAAHLHDKLRAAVALDDDAKCAATLRMLVQYIDAGEVQLRQTAWDSDRAPPPPTIKASYPDRCADCGGAVRVGDSITYDRDTRRTAHARCGGAAC